ncbi:DUF3667 domain-containing protein [Marivirga arenosa]|uniref:DUF3667 domain-containing protein n=1 Tax=Marivirga arenosa TaxID=3059076 RepID=A0AA49GCN5_9BACT|nr:DUF3667 domain-containing protein [Marivirga sp. BKB1-2]WKK81644.1 DUF3667 domain-containing protein [Marivirga sp. BKB1-2]
MKENHKCLNCGEELDSSQNFCPNCGQENSDKKLPIGEFLKDFFSNTLSFDTILFKTINPFLFRPGKLTRAFNEGKRRRYINPIRLYLIFSLFYFFMIGLTVPKDFLDSSIRSVLNQKEILDSARIGNLDSAGIQAIVQKTKTPDSLVKEIEKASKKVKDSTDRWATLKYWADDNTLNDQEFEANLDSIGFDQDLFETKIIRSFINNSSIFTYQAVRNLPLMMFIFLPIFALILKLLFFKKRYYYIEHLIHGLHLHAFAYFIYGLGILIISLYPTIDGTVIFVSFIWVSTYALFSIKKLYNNGWFKSFLKFIILGVFYGSLLVFGFLLELYISLISL